tara:strand:+ start:356 stop:586 length:231 start_codon:yes stop_codon:yes gene_type:complete
MVPQKPQQFAPIKHKASITAHGADPMLGPTGTYMALCLICANRHGADLLSFCFQQNRYLTEGLAKTSTPKLGKYQR